MTTILDAAPRYLLAEGSQSGNFSASIEDSQTQDSWRSDLLKVVCECDDEHAETILRALNGQPNQCDSL